MVDTKADEEDASRAREEAQVEAISQIVTAIARRIIITTNQEVEMAEQQK